MSSADKNHSFSGLLLKRVIPFIFYALLIIFLYFYLRSIDYSQLKDASFNWWYMLIALVLGVGARYWGALIWFVILNGLGAKDLKDKTQLLYVYAKSWMGRYIPGTAPWILGKIYFASQHGISKNKLAVSSLLEGGLQIIVTMTVASIILILDPRLDVIDTNMKLLMGGLVLVGIIAVVPPVFNRLMSLAYKIIRKKKFDEEHYVNNKTILSGASLYALGAFINGFSLFFVAKAVYPDLDYSDMLFVLGTGSLAGAVSMLVVFAPSGIGVREGIQLVLLNLIMPTEFALVVVVFTRILSVIMDFMFFGMANATRGVVRTLRKRQV